MIFITSILVSVIKLFIKIDILEHIKYGDINDFFSVLSEVVIAILVGVMIGFGLILIINLLNKIIKNKTSKKILISILLLIIGICFVMSNSKNFKINGFNKIQLNEKIANKYAEIIFKNVIITDKASDSKLNIELNYKNNNTYFIIQGNIKNLNTTAFNFISNIDTKLVFDEKYEYSVTVAPNELLNINPLENKDFMLYVSVPKEVIDVCKSYSLKIGYNNDFSNCSLNNCDNKYELIGEVNQYGSAENVINFETFKEYIIESARKYKELSCKEFNNNNYVIVSDGNALQFKTLEDGESEFDIQPTFRFSYSSISEKCIPALIINFNTAKHPQNIYYNYASTLTLSSSNGSVKIEDNSTNKILIDTYKSINLLETDFVFSSLDYDLEQIKSIINGKNLKITVMVPKTPFGSSDYAEVTFDCNEEIVNSFKQLFELNSSIVKKY